MQSTIRFVLSVSMIKTLLIIVVIDCIRKCVVLLKGLRHDLSLKFIFAFLMSEMVNMGIGITFSKF